MEPKDDFYGNLQKVEKLERYIREGDIATAASGIEMLPEDVDKNPLYARIALNLAEELCKLEESELTELGRDVLTELLNHYKDKCDYFSKK